VIIFVRDKRFWSVNLSQRGLEGTPVMGSLQSHHFLYAWDMGLLSAIISSDGYEKSQINQQDAQSEISTGRLRSSE
jgi:hypothetical protein